MMNRKSSRRPDINNLETFRKHPLQRGDKVDLFMKGRKHLGERRHDGAVYMCPYLQDGEPIGLTFMIGEQAVILLWKEILGCKKSRP